MNVSRAVVRPAVDEGIQLVAWTRRVQPAVAVSEHLIVGHYETLRYKQSFISGARGPHQRQKKRQQRSYSASPR